MIGEETLVRFSFFSKKEIGNTCLIQAKQAGASKPGESKYFI